MHRIIALALPLMFFGCLSTNESVSQKDAVTGDPSKGSQPVGINNSDPSKSNFQSIPFVSKGQVAESLAVESPALAKTAAEESYVGVIPQDGKCPDGTPQVSIYMDDEDDGNQSSISFPYGPTPWGVDDGYSYNTQMTFCQVKGSQFHPSTDGSNPSSGMADYAVLKLSGTCPEGSNAFNRFFDNEDDNNKDNGSGPISPNLVEITSYGNAWNPLDPSRRSGNWRLQFCYFIQYGALNGGERPSFYPNENTRFPNLGFEYSVFAPSNASTGAATDTVRESRGHGLLTYVLFGHPFATNSLGNVYTDDEDDNNENTMSLPGVSIPNLSQRVRRIIDNAGGNTRMWIAKVNHW